MANRDVRLAIFEDNNFGGRRVQFRRGGVAITNMQAIRFDQMLSSFRLRNVVSRNEVTLVLFSRDNFQGNFRVFRGTQNVASLGDFNDRTESLLLIGRNLSNSEINTIRRTGTPPRDILIIRQ
ncbi:beta/gamma crystallin family protein [Paenibacillus allorhizosphaerae]|uniref:Uncharacterized protein n=1 Tax=Paenibacillus allorhizosphaerae TaxID=2849866 RepID=A0ABM8VLA2_9BACL|nr:beta/gamma crystallin family protein [Paenibacillus allorhizosphaerae]CAG7647748.1 hypothetical protein PAECIP111802_04054 [Paenibacillus allorhizosphaerae]